MPSAVSAKVADILSRYSRPHSAASLRSSSPSAAPRPPLKLHQSADLSHARFPRADDDDDELLLSSSSRPQHHHRTATAPQRSWDSRKAKAAARDEDDVDIVEEEEKEEEEEETVYSEEETATVRRSLSTSSLSSSQRPSRASKVASRRADEWEDEMMDEFGDDDDGDDAAAPVKQLPVPASHTRSASAPASKKGAVPVRTLHARPNRAAADAEAVVEFEEELLIADSPVHARQVSAPSVVAKPTVSVVREEEEEDEEVYSEVEEAQDEPAKAVSAPAAVKPAVIPSLRAAAYPATVPTTPAAASQHKQAPIVAKEEEVITEDEKEEEDTTIRSFLAASASPPAAPASSSGSAQPKTDEYEEDFEDVKMTPRPASFDTKDSRADERRQQEKPTTQPQSTPPQPAQQKDSTAPSLSSHAAGKKYQQQRQEDGEAAAADEERLVLIDDDYRQQREDSRAAASRSQRRKKRYIHITSISTQTDVSHNPLPLPPDRSSPQQQPPHFLPYYPPALMPPPLPASPAAAGYGYHPYYSLPVQSYPYYAMQPPSSSPYYYQLAPPAAPPAWGWPMQQPYWPHAQPMSNSHHPSFSTHPYSAAGAWHQPSASLSASFVSPPQPLYTSQSASSPQHVSSISAPSPSTQPTSLPLRVNAWPEQQPTATAAAAAATEQQTASAPQPEQASAPSAVTKRVEEEKTRQQTVSSSPFRSGPVTVDAFVSATPSSRLVQALSSPLRSACGSCGSLPSPSPLYFSSITPFPASSRPVNAFFTRSYSSAPAGVCRSPGLSLCSDTLYPVSAGLNAADANAAFRQQLSVLRSSLNSYRSALELALP